MCCGKHSGHIHVQIACDQQAHRTDIATCLSQSRHQWLVCQGVRVGSRYQWLSWQCCVLIIEILHNNHYLFRCVRHVYWIPNCEYVTVVIVLVMSMVIFQIQSSELWCCYQWVSGSQSSEMQGTIHVVKQSHELSSATVRTVYLEKIFCI